MRIVLLFIVLLSSYLHASKILSYNIYERENTVDMMLTFDTPYEGSIKQHTSASKIVIKLEKVQIESPKVKAVHSDYVKEVTITPIADETQIIVKTSSKTNISVSKTSDAYGLRLRFSKVVLANTKQGNVPLPTKNDTEISTNYIIVVVILLVLVIALLILKRRIASGSNTPWLSLQKAPKEDISIRFQKALDTKNRVVMLEHGNESYLMVLGTTNILLDKFEGESVRQESQFESMLNEKRDSIDSFLQIDSQESDEGLNSYKEKASNINYHT